MTAATTDPAVDHSAQSAASLAAARDHLRKLQHPHGWWKAELETNVTMDAEDLMLRYFLGILDPELAAASAQWIRSNQRHDGTWSTFFGGPPDLSTTVEAYVALRLAGDPADSPSLRQAAEWVRANGGLARSRVFTRIWLAILGRWDWNDLPVVPPEIMYLPPWAPLNIYDFGCWARQTVVALTIVMAHRPARTLPFTLDELLAPEAPELPAGRPGRPGRMVGAADHQRKVLRPRPGSPPLRTTARLVPPPTPAPPVGAAAGRAMDRSPSRSRRALGRDTTPRRLLDHGPAPPGVSPRPPRDASGTGRPRRLRHPR